jgi:hypothetical protein
LSFSFNCNNIKIIKNSNISNNSNNSQKCYYSTNSNSHTQHPQQQHPQQPPIEPPTGSGAQKGTIASDFEQSVGVERLQLLSELAGRALFSSSQPLQHRLGAQVKGTLSDPVVVESLRVFGEEEGRIVGCSGQPKGSHEIGFFWVKSARECTRCPECGQAFKLELV